MDFGVFDPSEFVYGVLWGIALNPALMIIIWVFLVILEFCWSGLRNLITIILFPGKLIHFASHILFAHLKGHKMRFISILGIGRERSVLGVMLGREHPLWVVLYCIFPAIIAVPLYLIFREMAMLFYPQRIFALLFLWLAMSIFVEGMPSLEDMGVVLKMSIYYEPLSIIFLSLAPVVFALNMYGFGMEIGTYITVFYVFSIIILSLVGWGRGEEVYGE